MISAVKKRELNLLRKNYSPAPYGLNKMYESVLTKYNPKTAKTVLENWDHLAKDPNIAFTKAFLVMEAAYINDDSESNINTFTNIFTENIIPKVRNALQMQKLISHRLGNLKSKLSTKIHTKVKKISGTYVQPKKKQSKQEQPKQENYIYKSLDSITEAVNTDSLTNLSKLYLLLSLLWLLIILSYAMVLFTTSVILSKDL